MVGSRFVGDGPFWPQRECHVVFPGPESPTKSSFRRAARLAAKPSQVTIAGVSVMPLVWHFTNLKAIFTCPGLCHPTGTKDMTRAFDKV